MRLEIGAGAAAGRAGGVLWSSAILAAISPLGAAFTSRLPAPAPALLRPPRARRFPPLPPPLFFVPRLLCSRLVCPCLSPSLWVVSAAVPRSRAGLVSQSLSSGVSLCPSVRLGDCLSHSLSPAPAICQLSLLASFLPRSVTPVSRPMLSWYPLDHHLSTTASVSLVSFPLWWPPTPKAFPPPLRGPPHWRQAEEHQPSLLRLPPVCAMGGLMLGSSKAGLRRKRKPRLRSGEG